VTSKASRVFTQNTNVSERCDALVAERVRPKIDVARRETEYQNRCEGDAQLLARQYDIKFDFGVDVVNTSISCAARGHNVLLLASGKVAEYAGRKINSIRPDLFFNYVNFKDDAERF